MRAILILALLSACAPGTTFVIKATEVVIPEHLTYCPHPTHKVAPLPPVRSTKQLADYANTLELSREELLADLAECDKRRSKLMEKINER